MAFEKTIPLNEFITLQRGFDLPQDKRIKGDIPVIASTGIVGYHNEEKVQAPGVVIGRSGSIGGGQYITNNFWPLNTTLWVKDFKGHHPRFVYYLLKSIDFSQFNVGSGVPTLNRNHLSGVLVADTSYSYEKEVSNVIGILDDKINLNKKINQTLEQMSQTLFKSWFVDFDPVIDNALDAGNPIPEALQSRAELRQKVRNSADFKPLPAEIRSLFPSEFEETELGWVPKGWKIDNIGGLSDKIFSGGTPNTSTEEYWNGALNWFSSGETRNALIIETEKKITATGVKNSSTRLSVAGDILIASAGQGHTRGQTSLNTIDTYINQSVVCIRPIKPSYSTWLYFNLSSRYTEMRAISDSHSIRGSLTTKLISSMKVASPTDELISLFDINCSVFISKIKNNLELRTYPKRNCQIIQYDNF
ncbi:restriction endonuclease subunit S [Escherichia coli]|uniref:restriction endonuclease subunit S n=1 Tax=Escherichia coli TaxID=562 RepID=UPI00222FA769|nr:restriction endonuclease subunit S [Escherichia coli]MDM8618645.1 restriction endonuclease subunit S [Escherichia coli]WNU16716.1 restriction endonuclease subunit S [Escherichia coli]